VKRAALEPKDTFASEFNCATIAVPPLWSAELSPTVVGRPSTAKITLLEAGVPTIEIVLYLDKIRATFSRSLSAAV
jgi:hypothetical protein